LGSGARLKNTVCFGGGGGGGGGGHERERMEDYVNNNLVLREYDKNVFFI